MAFQSYSEKCASDFIMKYEVYFFGKNFGPVSQKFLFKNFSNIIGNLKFLKYAFFKIQAVTLMGNS